LKNNLLQKLKNDNDQNSTIQHVIDYSKDDLSGNTMWHIIYNNLVMT